MAKVLIVDDAVFMRGLMADIVEGSGHTPIEACDGVEGLDAIRRERPDLVFLDLAMPRMDGFGVLEALQSFDDPPPVIVLSADIQPEIQKRVFNLGAIEFLNKPPNVMDIVGTMEANISSQKEAV